MPLLNLLFLAVGDVRAEVVKEETASGVYGSGGIILEKGNGKIVGISRGDGLEGKITQKVH